jgi:hypothetical protein
LFVTGVFDDTGSDQREDRSMLNKPQPAPLITITTRVFPETHESLRRLQSALGKSLPVVFKTIVRNYEYNLKRRLSAVEWANYERGLLTPAQLNASSKRKTHPAEFNGHAASDVRK